MVITAGDAQRVRQDTARVNHATYKFICGQIQSKIRKHAMMKHTCLTARVPEYVPGRPVFKVARAARYVSEKLRLLGFVVAVYGAGTNYFVDVSWKAAAPAPARPPKPTPPAKKHEMDVVVSAEDVSNRLDTLRRRLEGLM